MKLSIKIVNQLTGETVVDSTIEVPNDIAAVQANHGVFAETFPDCTVNFSLENGDFICGMARNQMKDELAYENGEMTWQDYCDKWYKGDPAGCNEDSAFYDDLQWEYMNGEYPEDF